MALYYRNTVEVFWPTFREDDADLRVELEHAYDITFKPDGEEVWTEVLAVSRAWPMTETGDGIECTAEECDALGQTPGFFERIKEHLADRACAQEEARMDARWDR